MAELHHSAFILYPSLCAFGSDWAQLEAGTCGRATCPFATHRTGSAASFLCGSTTPVAAEAVRSSKTCVATALNLGHRTSMQYRIRLIQSEEGWAVSCPSLPGCHSQGDTREQAVENIKSAIQEWLQVEAEESGVSKVEEDLVVV